MDIQYLLLLQEFRNGAGSFLTPFMLLISDLATYGGAAAAIVIYWAIDRIAGYLILINCMSGLLINSTIKLTACVYRPWIRHPGLVPPPRALEKATGYSFPSAHTQLAASIFGSVAVRSGKKAVRALCVILILLTAFSRNFLGVHTPQDVLVSMLIGALLLPVSGMILTQVQKSPASLNRILLAGCVVTVICICYYHFKTYPLDYADGALVVDPEAMKTDGYSTAGGILGALAGIFIEAHYIRFRTDGAVGLRILRVIGGLPLPALFLLFVKRHLYTLLGNNAGHMVLYAFIFFYVIALYPALFTAVRNRMERQKLN